jgi:RNA polymerase sigma-70 factor (ECF subfamily)
MERVRAQDVGAFEELYDGYHRLVFGIALRMTGDSTMAEDTTQAVFMKIWSAPDAFRHGNFAAWLARVARNRTLDLLRSRAVRSADEIPADLAAPGSLDETIFARIDAQRVREALGSLGEEQRVPIELGFFGGITHDEIARRTGIPLGTIKTRIRTGLRRLRDALSEAVSP